MLKVRLTTLEDVPWCVALSRDACMLNDASLVSRRVEWWREWLSQGIATSAVVVDETDTIYAFGLTAAVDDRFIAYVRTCGSSLALSSVQFRNRMTWRALLSAHRGEGVNLIGFYGWRKDVESPLLDQAQRLLLRSFLHLHRGLHLKSFTKEVFGEEELSSYVDMGCQVYRASDEYPSHLRGLRPALVGLERKQAKEHPRWATLLFQMFEHETPRLCLRSDQLLLVQLAYHLRLSNEQIRDWLRGANRWRGRSGAMGMLRQRWHRIYEACDMVYGPQWHRNHHNHWYDSLEWVEKCSEIAFPLQIGSLVCQFPELAYQYPLPL